jgi:hypothetical protein
VPNLVQIGRAAAEEIWRERKNKLTEKYNITKILKNFTVSLPNKIILLEHESNEMYQKMYVDRTDSKFPY